MAVKLDIAGPKGNAHYILAQATNLSRQLERDSSPILEEMMAGDYDNLLRVFIREFPMVTLVSPHEIESIDSELYTIEEDCYL